jgi:hypothetical protein
MPGIPGYINMPGSTNMPVEAVMPVSSDTARRPERF